MENTIPPTYTAKLGVWNITSYINITYYKTEWKNKQTNKQKNKAKQFDSQTETSCSETLALWLNKCEHRVFSAFVLESTILDEFCDYEFSSAGEQGRGRNYIPFSPLFKFHNLYWNITWNNAEFLCKYFTKLLMAAPFLCFEMTDETSYCSTHSLKVLCSSVLFW